MKPFSFKWYNLLLVGLCLALVAAWSWMVYQETHLRIPSDLPLDWRVGLETPGYLLPILAASFVLLSRNTHRRSVWWLARALAFGFSGLSFVYLAVLVVGIAISQPIGTTWLLLVGIVTSAGLPLCVLVDDETNKTTAVLK